MQFFIKTLTGKTLTIECELKDTVFHIKQKILEKENIPIEEQRIIFCGKELRDSAIIEKYNIHKEACLHLVQRMRSPITFDSHKFYVIVHNFYEPVEGAKLESFQYVIPILGSETPEEIQDILERIYKARQQRIEKNKRHVFYRPDSPEANPIIALVGVDKKEAVELYPADYGVQALISAADELSYKLLSYVLPDGTSAIAAVSADEKIRDLNQSFRLFCARKIEQEKQENVTSEIRSNYGEVTAYLEMTATDIFEDLEPDEINVLLEGIKNLCNGERPDLGHPLYTEILQFDIETIFDRFQVIKDRLAGHVHDREITIRNLREGLRTLLKDKVAEFEQTYKNSDNTSMVSEVAGESSEVDAGASSKGKERVSAEPENSGEKISKEVKVLAFDVSETLQVMEEQNVDGMGQPMVAGDEVIPGAFSLLNGGKETAALLLRAQELGIHIVLVSNNGGGEADPEVVSRTLAFLRNYGIHIAPEDYYGPKAPEVGSSSSAEGSKVPRLVEILRKYGISQHELLFFDDSLKNVEDARTAGFPTVHVRTPADLQQGIRAAISVLIERMNKQSEIYAAPADPERASLSYDDLPLEFRQYLSVESEQERHELGHISLREYWENLAIEKQEEWRKKFTENKPASGSASSSGVGFFRRLSSDFSLQQPHVSESMLTDAGDAGYDSPAEKLTSALETFKAITDLGVFDLTPKQLDEFVEDLFNNLKSVLTLTKKTFPDMPRFFHILNCIISGAYQKNGSLEVELADWSRISGDDYKNQPASILEAFHKVVQALQKLSDSDANTIKHAFSHKIAALQSQVGLPQDVGSEALSSGSHSSGILTSTRRNTERKAEDKLLLRELERIGGAIIRIAEARQHESDADFKIYINPKYFWQKFIDAIPADLKSPLCDDLRKVFNDLYQGILEKVSGNKGKVAMIEQFFKDKLKEIRVLYPEEKEEETPIPTPGL